MKKATYGYGVSLSVDAPGPVRITLHALGSEPATFVLKPGQQMHPVLKKRRRIK